MFILIVLLYFCKINRQKLSYSYAGRYLFCTFKINHICITFYQALDTEIFSIFVRLAM